MTSEDVKRMAREAGFDLCGIAPAEAFPELEHFDEWLAAGYAGEMRYLERSAVRRADVRNVVPAARSVVALGVIYNTDRPYSTEVNDPDAALIIPVRLGRGLSRSTRPARRYPARADAGGE